MSAPRDRCSLLINPIKLTNYRSLHKCVVRPRSKDAKFRSHHRGFIVSCPNGVRTGDGNGEETRMSPNLVRLSGLAAILRGVLDLLLSPVLAYLWATNSDKYGYFGRAYFLVFLGCLSGLAGLYGGRTSCPDLWPGCSSPRDRRASCCPSRTYPAAPCCCSVAPGWCRATCC
jgi:hypothetical protein